MNDGQDQALPSAAEGTVQSQQQLQEQQQPQSVGLTQLRAPSFYRNNPEAWFLTLEAQFILGRVSEAAKFYHLVSNLPEDIAALHLSASAPRDYKALKEGIVATLQKSKQEKVAEILQVSDLGGDKPSIFIRKLRGKMEQCHIQPDEEVLKATLMRCLPQDFRIALSGFQQQSAAQLADIADSMLIIRGLHGAPPTTVCAAQERSEKYFVIELPSGGTDTVSINRLRPARLRPSESPGRPQTNQSDNQSAQPAPSKDTSVPSSAPPQTTALPKTTARGRRVRIRTDSDYIYY